MSGEPKWRERDGVITLTLPVTDGTSGEQWMARLQNKGNTLSGNAGQVLLSPKFESTTGVIYKPVILKGELFSDGGRRIPRILAEAKRRELIIPEAEVACLIRENFSNEELQAMGLHFIGVLHKAIHNFAGQPKHFYVVRHSNCRLLDTYYGESYDEWDIDSGFAFLVPQAS